jgi:hypothetical protein
MAALPRRDLPKNSPAVDGVVEWTHLDPGALLAPTVPGLPHLPLVSPPREPHGVSPLTRQLRRGLRALGMPITHHYHRKIRYLAHGQNLRWATEGG